jgi:hypothetical protein
MPYRDSGWTMDRFIEWMFGAERVFSVATLVDETQRVAERLFETPADENLLRALRLQLRGLRDTADVNRWVKEGDIAAGLADRSVLQVRVGLRLLQQLVQNRLAHVIGLNRPAAA